MYYVKRFAGLIWGLFICAVGIYLTIQANIGLPPWDAFSMGLSYALGTSYGDASVYSGLAIIGLDLILKEKIGFGTLLNTLLIGKMVDLLTWLDLIPMLHNFWWGLLMLLTGQAVTYFGCYYYMGASMGCGPRDSLMVALGKRLNRIPIGVVRICIEGTVLCIGWLLGAKVGWGTLIFVASAGGLLELIFRLLRFDVKALVHEGFLSTIRNIRQKHYPTPYNLGRLPKKEKPLQKPGPVCGQHK